MATMVRLTCASAALAMLTCGAANSEPSKVTSATGKASYSVHRPARMGGLVFEDAQELTFTGKGQSIRSSMARPNFSVRTDVETAYGNAYQAPAVISNSYSERTSEENYNVSSRGEITYRVAVTTGGLGVYGAVPIRLKALLKTEVEGDGSAEGRGSTEANAELSIMYRDVHDIWREERWRSCSALNVTRCPLSERDSEVPVNASEFKTLSGREFIVTIKTHALVELGWVAPNGNLNQWHQNASAFAFVDPFFYIDPEWLEDNPGYSLEFSPGIENSLAVPEPRAWMLLLIGFGSAGVALRCCKRLRAEAGTIGRA